MYKPRVLDLSTGKHRVSVCTLQILRKLRVCIYLTCIYVYHLIEYLFIYLVIFVQSYEILCPAATANSPGNRRTPQGEEGAEQTRRSSRSSFSDSEWKGFPKGARHASNNLENQIQKLEADG